VVGRLLAREPTLRDRLLDTYTQLPQLAGFLTYYATAEQPPREGPRFSISAIRR